MGALEDRVTLIVNLESFMKDYKRELPRGQ